MPRLLPRRACNLGRSMELKRQIDVLVASARDVDADLTNVPLAL
jgi:hypothetical protein